MKVADLQQHLRSLIAFVEAAEPSKKTLGSLTSASELFEPFRECGIDEFAEFLRNAVVAVKEGRWPEPKGKAGAKPRAAAKPKADAGKLIEDLFHIYETMPHTNLADADIEAQTLPVEKLTGPSLQTLADRLGIGPQVKKLKTVPAKKQAVRREFLDRKHRVLQTEV
jgi:hypothetical protein